MIVWNPVTGPADRHDKEIVQPFGEYLPMPWLFKHLSAYADRAGHMVPGKSSDVVQIAGVPVGVATCWEVIFDREPRKAVLNGAQLLAVPSNNATFNKKMSEQQLAFAKVRAVEHDRYVVVAGTTGISAVIAPDGGELVRTGLLPARLSGHPGAPQDEADAGDPLGSDPAMGPGRGGRSGHSGRDTAQWMVPASDSAEVQVLG